MDQSDLLRVVYLVLILAVIVAMRWWPLHRWSATTQTQEPPSSIVWSEEDRQVSSTSSTKTFSQDRQYIFL
ncbi:MAG: hypothetical protein ACP59X_07020 [Solidesulfovibrio sp. DCME]|uniref:hypothetical protein n=1 Tax=Solidesulfovibrio sp. DCME TaxID=3447380 RepID=UPI003D0CAD17